MALQIGRRSNLEVKLMKRTLIAAAMTLSLGSLSAPPALADGCYICTSGSPCQQCRYTGSDTQAERKKCRDSGCKIGGTKSCSTAANIKTCRASLGISGPQYAEFDALLNPAR
jgi:hypothetical protein